MVELTPEGLRFSFPDVHPDATLDVGFQRTLRIPDDDRTYPLPPGLGPFPMKHVDDVASRVPPAWQRRGGVLLPMFQSEALWINFEAGMVHNRGVRYPFAVKVAAGKINAVTGQSSTNDLAANPQDYLVAPDQPWLDGFCVAKGVIRQFVAMPLGGGYTAEEQLTGQAEHGGLQILVRPMSAEAFERRFPRRRAAAFEDSEDIMACYRMEVPDAAMDMGLAPGGRMKQEILKDDYGLADWDTRHQSRAFVHLTNSLMWEAVTGEKPPSPPPTAKLYTQHGLPWFEHYADDHEALGGAEALNRLRSVIEMARAKGEPALPENESVAPANVVALGRRTVRDSGF